MAMKPRVIEFELEIRDEDVLQSASGVRDVFPSYWSAKSWRTSMRAWPRTADEPSEFSGCEMKVS
jgi:hypothetical protein